MKRTWTFFALLVATLALSALPTDAARKRKPAAAAGPATLRVHVVDERGRSVFHARVAVKRLDKRGHTVGRTNRGGNYDSRHAAGTFSVRATHVGMLTAAAMTVLRQGDSRVIEIRMGHRRAVVVHAHEVHQLGVIHYDKEHHLIDHAHLEHLAHAAAKPAAGSIEEKAKTLHP